MGVSAPASFPLSSGSLHTPHPLSSAVLLARTGKLYKKGQEGGAYTQTEYTLALQRLDELRGELGSLRTRANRGDDADAVGAQAAAVRVGLRQTGERVARSLAGDERIDTEQRLLATVRILDDVDAVAERQSAADSKAAGPLSSVSLLLDRAVVSFDDFRRALPTSPDPYAT